ncbi:MAG: PHP domain-containing protein, partial [Patescibacteria group bacterium]|nr:PHP domain-containing protein [Patescibacteria group bacterium]
MNPNFVPLHVHSHYSLLDGLAKIDDLISRAKEYNLPAMALTDHGVMYGAIEFYKKAKAAEIKPIIGCEMYIAPRNMTDKTPKIDTSPYHLVLLAKNLTGYKNLMRLVSEAHLKGYYYKPRIDKNLLRKYAEGLVALTACIQG